jgi:3-deoxy-D-manno-octulosonic-acid transferase
MRALYSLMLRLAQPLLLRKLRRRADSEPGYLEAVPERFGRYDAAPRAASEGPLLWIHAVSLGETRAAGILLSALRRQRPDLRVLLTHGTATGRDEGRKLLRADDRQAWLPWDTPGAVDRFLRHFQPSAGVLMETEVWPNLVAACVRRRVPLALANARLNGRSLARAQRLAWLARPAFSSLSAVWAQSEDDAARLRQLGAPVQGIFGNLKFDARPDEAQRAMGQQLAARVRRPVVMLASSREGEELAWIAALRSLAPDRQAADAGHAATPADERVEDANGVKNVQWLVVPRHPQRFDAVAQLLQDQGLSVSRRSTWALAEAFTPPEADVWLGDSLGEMALYYGLARAALLGGSFEPLGGQNLIEAAACGCPVVMGPSTFNFAEAATLAEAAGVAIRVPSMEAGLARATRLALDDEEHARRSLRAQAFSREHQGAAARTADAVLELISAPAAR